MSCGISDARVKFENSGIELAPYQVDLRIDRGKFDHCRAKVDREAGKMVADQIAESPNEPVTIYSSEGKKLRRMYIPDTGVEISQEKAWLTFYDPLHLTTNGICNKTYSQGVTLSDVMGYIMSNVSDPNGVIQGFDITDPQYSDDIQPNYQDFREASLFEQAEDYNREGTKEDGIFGDVGNSIQGGLADAFGAVGDSMLWTNRLINKHTGIWGDTGKLDFDEKTPHEALKIVAEEWELDFWVDQVGILWMGKKEASPKVHVASPSPETLTVAEYNVTTQAIPVAEVVVRGGKTRLGYDRNDDGEQDGVAEVANRGVMTYGQARVGGVENGRTITVQNKELQEGEALKNAAERRLIQELSKAKSGNVKLNPDFSGYTDFSKPNEINLGDYLMVNGYKNLDACETVEENGEFIVNSIHHDMKGDRGWEITLETAHVPDQEISSRFFYYKPDENEVVDANDLYYRHGVGPIDKQAGYGGAQ